MKTLLDLTRHLQTQEEAIRRPQGRSKPAAPQQGEEPNGRMPVRQRLETLLDPGGPWLELGIWAAWEMYPEWGQVPAAGVVTGIGCVHGRRVLVVANDASVKAGAFFPQTVKKVLRAQRIAAAFRLPLVYLVDSSGVFLPLEDEVFPDEDDFGRIFRNNAVLSALGIPQYAAVMGHCVAGGAYLPVLSDTLLMTEGSQLDLAGPALVKAAIGQEVEAEELGGAAMHARISGTADYRDPDDAACLRRLRRLIELLPERDGVPAGGIPAGDPPAPQRDPQELYDLVPANGHGQYDAHDVLACLVDAGSWEEYRCEFGPTVVTGFARLGGRPAGLVANQRKACRSGRGEMQIGGVLYGDAAEKAARFVMQCNQSGLPLVFLQDVQGFMVGKQAEQSGIIRAGAKLVNVVSNSVVPKLTVILGGSFGAGNYALCGKAYDPWLILAWPSARYAVMGAEQAADTLLSLQRRDAQRRGSPLSDEQQRELRDQIRQRYDRQTDIRYGAARGWVDAVIPPHDTRQWLATALAMIPERARWGEFRTGLLQV